MKKIWILLLIFVLMVFWSRFHSGRTTYICNPKIVIKKLSFSGTVYKRKRLIDGHQTFYFIHLDSFFYDGWTTGRDKYQPSFYTICDNRGISIRDSTLLLRGNGINVGSHVYSRLGDDAIYISKYAGGDKKRW